MKKAKIHGCIISRFQKSTIEITDFKIPLLLRKANSPGNLWEDNDFNSNIEFAQESIKKRLYSQESIGISLDRSPEEYVSNSVNIEAITLSYLHILYGYSIARTAIETKKFKLNILDTF